jgi:hypothetical protein
MQNDDQQLENFLREFRPVTPRALPELSTVNLRKWQRLAAAAVLLVAVVGALWLTELQPEVRSISTARNTPIPRVVPPPPATSTMEFRRMALEHPEQFDAAVTAASQRILPRFDRADSSLRVLAEN